MEKSKEMIPFKKFSDIVNKISKKFKIPKNAALRVAQKAQERGINLLKWQQYLSMLGTFANTIPAENDPRMDERTMSSKQKRDQMQYYWKNLDHMASDERKKKNMKMRFGIKNIKLDRKGGKLVSFDESDEKIKEAKQGHALVVGGKVVARGSKKQLLKKVKKDGIKIDHKKNFLAYTGKEVGDNW